MSIEQTVRNFQVAAASGRQDDCTELYSQIRQDCCPVMASVYTRYRNLGTFVEEIGDQKLSDCLLSFVTGDFKAYLRRALTNAADTEYKRRKRFDDSKDPEETKNNRLEKEKLRLDELEEQRSRYATRKRKLIDQLSFLSSKKLSTLLLDQRWRMAAKAAKSADASMAYAPSGWVEKSELWHGNDERRFYDGKFTPYLQQVWNCFGARLDAEPADLTQRHMVLAIEEAGGFVTSVAWRQRVCRCLTDVEAHVSQPEWKLFHVHD